MIKCLEAAKIAYKNLLDLKDIEAMYEALTRQKEQGLDTGANLAQQLTKFAAEKVKNREQELIAQQLLELRNGQALLDTIQRVKDFRKRGVSNAVKRGLMAKIAGTQTRIFRGRESTELKMTNAKNRILRELANAFNNELAPIWNSKKFELEIVDGLMKAHRGEWEAIKNPSIKRIVEKVKELQDRNLRGKREMGVYIHPLDDRVTPNIHSQAKILKLSAAERRSLKGKSDAEIYDYKFNRWKNFTYPQLDLVKTFTKNNVDYRDAKAVDIFMRHAFDNIINRGKVTQQGSNLAKKMQQPRVLHWQDAQSLVAYNERFGTGAIQDSIVRELAYGQAQLEYMKDWGSNATATIDRALAILEKDPELSRRENKANDEQKIKRLLNSLTRTDAEYAGGWGEFFRNMRAFETISKLGMVTIRSVPDLGLLANEAALHEVPAFNAMGQGIHNMVLGLPEAERLALKDLISVGIENQIGSVGKLDFEGYKGGSLMQTGARYSMKLNLLERWDHALRATVVSIVSRRLAQMRKLSWEGLSKENRETLGLYGFDKHDWEIIRNSSDSVVGNKRFITPDLIQDVSNEVIVNALRGKGAKNFSETRIQEYKDMLERKLHDYFLDRQEHVILRPGVFDEHFITLGLGMPDHDAGRQALKLFTQFKLYSVAYARVPLGSALYGNGARDFREATLGRKGDYVGAAKLMGYMMALKYASMTISNAISGGLTPPSLAKFSTWMEMFSEAAGIYGMFLNIDPTNISESLAHSAIGPGPSDIFKTITLGYNFVKEGGDQLLFGEGDYTKTAKSFNNLVRGSVPKYPYTALVLNNLLLKELEDFASPGTRDRYLSILKQKQGVEPIF